MQFSLITILFAASTAFAAPAPSPPKGSGGVHSYSGIPLPTGGFPTGPVPTGPFSTGSFPAGSFPTGGPGGPGAFFNHQGSHGHHSGTGTGHHPIPTGKGIGGGEGPQGGKSGRPSGTGNLPKPTGGPVFGQLA